jgi:hypothetical protein
MNMRTVHNDISRRIFILEILVIIQFGNAVISFTFQYDQLQDRLNVISGCETWFIALYTNVMCLNSTKLLTNLYYVLVHNYELCYFYKSSITLRTVKPKRLRWARNISIIGNRRNAYRNLVGKYCKMSNWNTKKETGGYYCDVYTHC